MRFISALFAVSLLVSVPASAGQEIKSAVSKDMCLLDSANCSGQKYYSIVEKIAHLKQAIEIGSPVYSPEELRHLEHLLEEAFDIAGLIDADPSQVPENRFK